MDMQTKNFFILYFGSYARIVFCVWCSIKSIIINPVQVVKVLITQDETTLILDYKLGKVNYASTFNLCNFETPS
jgi:hypothetical protein